MKLKTATLLLILPLQALASSIGFGLSRTESPTFEIDQVSRPSIDLYTFGETGSFQLRVPAILENPAFCALSEGAGCDLAALMLVVGNARNASQVAVTEAIPGPVIAFRTSATRVPVPGALGPFVTGLLVLGAIRRRRPI